MSPVKLGPPAEPPSVPGERASREVAEAARDQLKSTRATADSWQKGLAGLLGVITSILILKGSGAVDEWATWFAVLMAVLLGFAAIFGGLAAYMILDAAYGQPAAQDLEDIRRKSLYVWRYEQAAAAANKLRSGQILLILSVAIVGAVTVWSWFAPDAPSTPAFQISDDQGNCGQLGKADNGRLKITQDDDAVVVVQDVTKLTVVRTC